MSLNIIEFDNLVGRSKAVDKALGPVLILVALHFVHQ